MNNPRPAQVPAKRTRTPASRTYVIGAHRPDRRKKRKSCTKAVLKRRLRAQLAAALEQIRIMNRISIAGAQHAHLARAITLLEAVLEERAGSHLLRQQLSLCRERLHELERGEKSVPAEGVEIILERL
ncbi:MAG: hypothetical protein NT045_00230 [Candidatus Aureabacteria bacterium]|nr:hypothetical protein [Candidatus Auribacterota bacterium]